MLREEKKVVIKAISDLGHRVTAADVASKTGLSLSDSSTCLNQIAAEAGGHLEVSKEGDIAYRFKNGFQSAYLATGLRAFVGKVLGKIYALIFYLLKISFGLFLSLSIVIVVTSFIVIAMLSSQIGTDRKDYNLFDLLEFFNFLIFRDLIFGGAAAQLQRRGSGSIEDAGEDGSGSPGSGKKRGNFFVNCFSFLFGEGNPNNHLEEEKWQFTAQAIRENHGVVIKEQLAPYIGPELDDEDTIFPVLARFDGRPVVTSRGNIAYIFPSLQVTTDHSQGAPEVAAEDIASVAARQSYLEEELWKFSHLSRDDLRAVKIVAVLNLFGTLWMYFIFIHMLHLRWQWPQIMVIYGAMFLLIPLVRYLWQTALNHSIKIRNYERHEAAKVVSQPDREVKQKLMERQEFINAAAIREVQADKLAFSTESESLDQQFKELELTSSDNQKPNAALEMIVQNMNETVLRKDESAGYSAESMDPGNEINRDESNRDESNRDSQ